MLLKMKRLRLHSKDNRKIGDVMPFYDNGEYHIFYLLNGSGNDNVNWEHAVSSDLMNWSHLPPAISLDKNELDSSGMWLYIYRLCYKRERRISCVLYGMES